MPSTGTVAYFSPEFGLDASLPQYSGGLGALAGDHLKACGDLGVPVVGVGLLYRHGYFRQQVGGDGSQEAVYPAVDPEACGLVAVAEAGVEVGDDDVALRVWRDDRAGVPLYLVDAGVDANGPGECAITDRLYGGDREHRLRQEIVLGMGGLHALDAVGVEPAAFHLNEGHAGFLALERIRREMAGGAASLAEAVERIRPTTIFTTHTPVPAGIDRFSEDLVRTYFLRWCKDCGVEFDDLLALGAMEGDPEGTFNMAALCLAVSGHANGVSRLHGEVSRRMFALPAIGSVTNGVHAPTWTAPELSAVVAGEGPEKMGDDEIRHARRAAKERLGAVVSERSVAGGALDPGAFTIGFARRFAPYKRADLLLADRPRLLRLLADPDRPAQLLFAGKAHPADGGGQEILASVASLAAAPDASGRVLFLRDYDMDVARAMVAGCDLWLNTPVRGEEACGTSGMKAALNGVLNCSVLDGWWDEMYDGGNGWAIPSRDDLPPGDARDRLEAAATLDLLESEVIPLYYRDGPPGPSAAWLARVRHAWITLGPRVTATRMVREYVDHYYGPATRRA